MKTNDPSFEYTYDPEAEALLPFDRDITANRRKETTLAPAIEAVLKRLQIEGTPWFDALIERWQQVAAPEIAACTRPVKWERGTLYLEVTGSTKLFELRRFKLREIEKAAREAAGAGHEIRHVHLIPGNSLK